METLTYRLLEVEERLAAQEERLATASEGAFALQDEALVAQLEDTALRLGRIEAALGGLDRSRDHGRNLARDPARSRDSAVAGRRLQALAQPAAWPDPDPQEIGPDPDPFDDDGEQAFMDERTA
jgi:uncharacterized membrane protein YccC